MLNNEYFNIDLAWQNNHYAAEPEDSGRPDPLKLLPKVEFSPAILGDLAYPDDLRVYVVHEVLACYIQRTLDLSLNTPIEVGKSKMYKYLRLADGRMWAENRGLIIQIKSAKS